MLDPARFFGQKFSAYPEACGGTVMGCQTNSLEGKGYDYSRTVSNWSQMYCQWQLDETYNAPNVINGE